MGAEWEAQREGSRRFLLRAFRGASGMAARGLPSKYRCQAGAKQAHRQCWNWGYPNLKPDGTGYRVCRYHSAVGAEYRLRLDARSFPAPRRSPGVRWAPLSRLISKRRRPRPQCGPTPDKKFKYFWLELAKHLTKHLDSLCSNLTMLRDGGSDWVC